MDHITDELITYITQKVRENLTLSSKEAVVLFTGSTLGFEKSIKELELLKQEGYGFSVYLTESAKRVLDVELIKNALAPRQILGGEGFLPEQLATQLETLIIPTMTINTAAKLAACISDTEATRLISTALMRGKRVIAVVDGCCPDNRERMEKGFIISDSLRQQLKRNMDKIQGYGISLTTSDKLYKKVLGKKKEDETRQQATAHFDLKVLGEKDVEAYKGEEVLIVSRNTLITQMAKEAADMYGIKIIKE